MYAQAMATALGEYKTTRAERSSSANGHRPPRPAPSVVIARWLASHLPELATVRTVILNLLAAVLLVYGVFLVLGLGAACIVGAFVLLVGDWWLHAQVDGP
jgi:hypothetical protein